jgi:CDP-diacylglycerol--glycerol-3-phosphate 3-phosphatidyltransferase
MKIINRFAKRHPDYFKYQEATEVYAHDHFLAWTILRFIPKSWTPNQFTMARICLTPLVAWLMATHNYNVGIVVFVLAALTDAIDGSLARTQNKITKFGMLFDPLADKFLIGVMVLFLVLQNYSWQLGLAIIGVELIIIVSAIVAEFRFNTVRAANIWGKIKMILQVLAVFLTLAALIWNATVLFTIAAWLFGVAIGFAIISLFAHGI